ILPSAVDVGQDDVIGRSQSRAEGMQLRGSSGVPVRLKGHDHSPSERLRGGEDGGDLRGVMAVVVDDQDAVGLAAYVESPFHSAEFRQTCGDPFERQTQLETDRNGGKSVLQVVTTGHVQDDRAEGLWTAASTSSYGRAAVERAQRNAGGRD